MQWKRQLMLLGSLVFPLGLGADPEHEKRYAIMDNDWYTASFVPFLTVLDGDIDVLALTSVTGDTWEPQGALHAVANLEVGNLSCIPVFEGPLWPLVNTLERFAAWQAIHGSLPFQGAFGPRNESAEAEGQDPAGGDPRRIVKEAFYEGFPKGIPDASMSAAQFMVEAVKKYPGRVSIYAAGPLTNVALAVRLDPSFATLAKELVIMGGYVDVNMMQATGTFLQASINSDINLKIDPEAAKIALTADFPSITIVGNVANQVIATEEFLEEVYQVKNPYTELFRRYYVTGFPFWDETAAALMVDPSISLNQTSLYIDVDTAYDSPFYGNVYVYQAQFAPPNAGKANYVFEVDEAELKRRIKHGLQYPKTCKEFEKKK